MSFRNLFCAKRARLTGVAAVCAVVLFAASAQADLPPWLQHVVGASTAEGALYRMMHLPGADVLYPRPPREASERLAKDIAAKPEPALYALRARADEEALDEASAEADWKQYAQASNTPEARLELADYYDRRLATDKEIPVLTAVASLPAQPEEAYLAASQQRSWGLFNRLLYVLAAQASSPAQTQAAYDAFLARYPAEPAAYARALGFLLEKKDYPGAEALLARYRRNVPNDTSFPIRAEAYIAFQRDGPEPALAVYDAAFAPLWPAPLVKSYLQLLEQTHRQRAFVAAARAALAAHPDGPEAMNALARIFYYDQQAGRTPQALQTLDAFRAEREARKATWTPDDLFTLAALSTLANAPAEAARYDFALASMPGTLHTGEPAAQAGLGALTHLLLSAPEQPLALGAGNLTMYRDIATLDQGPGYWNGILSLWLNGTSPQSEYNSETAKAQTYFHRSKAAALLAELDAKFAAAPERAALHAELIAAEAQYGDPASVVASGEAFLKAFPNAPERVDVASLMADAYARQNNTFAEFNLYDSLLAELAAKTAGEPLTSASPAASPSAGDTTGASDSATTASATPAKTEDFLTSYTPVRPTLTAGDAYRQILDRYLARLVATKQLPQALTLLKRELDRSPNDPLLYERLATFLQQNSLTAGQEEVYKQAIAHFQTTGWYNKLARFYIGQKRLNDYATLTRQVVDIFSGTDLDEYFRTVPPADPAHAGQPQFALELNLYAHKRFPHDLVFTRNILTIYQTGAAKDAPAYEALLRQTWFTAQDLRDQFFAYLRRTGKLDAELAGLNAAPATDTAATNPAALDELSGLEIWTSHYELSAAPLRTLSALYPADPGLDDRAISIFRSLSYNDPTTVSLDTAAGIEQHLIDAQPDSPDRLATLGDLYAEATADGGNDAASIARAAPFWRRIPALHPGTPAGSLTSATIFWDYFQFDDALFEIHGARTRFNIPALYGYEAGAIEENRGDLPAAVGEYTAAAVRPVGLHTEVQLAWATLDALFTPPSDAADSNLQATAQAFFGTDEAEHRVLQLANRPATKALVDQATAKALAANPEDAAALTLRADVLVAQHRTAELAPLLTAAVARAGTEDQAAAIGTLAQSHNLTPVYELALVRQAALTPDPVGKIQLEYSLVASLEARKQTAQASSLIASVYAAHPRLLGVVRATVDFYGRSGQPAKAIATLVEASKVAIPTLAHDFTLEAANRANDSGDTAQARTLAMSLLPANPYDAPVLAVIATSYARAHDNAGLKTFYLAQLEQARTAPNLSRDERKADLALLRRGLIPALTRLNDSPGATDQYIALLSAYPEDAATAQEAALYALAHGQQTRLLDFLNTTVQQSPKDSRFAILLAQVETTFGDLPAALHAYDAAITIRKDRADLYQQRATLELQLAQTDSSQLDRAADDFSHLYALTYHDPQWQVRLAEIRARQSRSADAVAALRVAYIEGHPATGPVAAGNSFTVAAQLEQWNLLTEARTFAEQGVHLAGAALFTDANLASTGGKTYAQILTRLGKPDIAFTTLNTARRASLASSPSTSALQAAFGAATGADADATADADSSGDAQGGSTPGSEATPADADVRKQLLDQRRSAINSSFNTAIDAMGVTVETYFTPEQKAAYGALLDTLHATDAPLAIEAATAAGLAPREAAWRKQQLLTSPPDGIRLTTYTTLENQRLAFAELGATLEAYSARVAAAERDGIRGQAAQAYANAGDTASEMRVARASVLRKDPALRDRYLDLLLAHNPSALAMLASGSDATLADAAVNYTVAHGSFAQASATLAARGKVLPAVWVPANTALAGVYAAAPGNPAVISSFAHVLRAADTIGDRLSHPADAKQVLTGDVWFDFASRFGLFLNLPSQGSPTLSDFAAEDFLPAVLEQAPASTGAYLDLAETYAEANQVEPAQAEFAHVLELDPRSDDALAAFDDEALLLDRNGNHAGAVAQWRAGLELLRDKQDRGEYGEHFYTSFASIVGHAGERHVDLRPEIESVLRPYLAHNGNYRSNELLKAAYLASPTPAEGAALLVSLANAASDPGQVLGDVQTSAWLAPEAKNLVLARRIELARTAPADTDLYGPSREDRILGLQTELLTQLIDSGDYARAQALFDSLPAPKTSNSSLDRSRLLLAAHSGRLPALLAGYPAAGDAGAGSSSTPSLSTFTGVAVTLAMPNATAADLANARLLREYVFAQKQLAHTLLPTDFLALAQARLDTGDLPGALDVLRRLTLQPPLAATTESDVAVAADSVAAPDFYANADSAAALLEAAHHPAEALPFLHILTMSAPWSAPYKLRLAQAELAAGQAGNVASELAALAADASAPYATRVAAAVALATLKTGAPANLGSAELTLLAQPAPTAAQAVQPGFVAAQLAVATQIGTSPQQRMALLREALAASPTGVAADRARLALFMAETQGSAPPPPDTEALLDLLQQTPAPVVADTAVDATADGSGADTADDAPESADTSAAGSAESDTTSSPGSAVSLPPVAGSLDLPERIHLAEAISRVNASQPASRADAVQYLQLAIMLDAGSPHPDPGLPAQLKALQAAIALELRNTARRPVFHKDLDQKVNVRPRLTLARAAVLEGP